MPTSRPCTGPGTSQSHQCLLEDQEIRFLTLKWRAVLGLRRQKPVDICSQARPMQKLLPVS